MARADRPAPAGGGATAAPLQVTVVWSAAPGAADEVLVRLPDGATVRDALEASGLLQRWPDLAARPAGVWGRLRQPDDRLRDRDRVEIYRPLQVDPMEARRARQRRQRDRTKAEPARQAGPPSRGPGRAPTY